MNEYKSGRRSARKAQRAARSKPSTNTTASAPVFAQKEIGEPMIEGKMIVAQIKSENEQYRACPYVIVSTHPRFSAGTRFDYGFLDIALAEGYNILYIGNRIPELASHWRDGELVPGEE